MVREANRYPTIAVFKGSYSPLSVGVRSLFIRAWAVGEAYSPSSKALCHSLARKMGFRCCRLQILMRLWLYLVTGISKIARKVLCIDPFGEPIKFLFCLIICLTFFISSLLLVSFSWCSLGLGLPSHGLASLL